MKNTITLKPICKKQKSVLENLISLYLHDLSEYADDLLVNDEGRFIYNGLHYYFENNELIPFLVYQEDIVIGFILLNMGRYVDDDIDFSIHEFFILKSYRKKGLGSLAIKELFRNYKGKYKVGQLAKNEPAILFWRKLYQSNKIEYKEYTEIVDGLKCITQFFEV